MNIWLIVAVLALSSGLALALREVQARRPVWIACGAAMLAGLVGYLVKGAPAAPDQPMHVRLDELAARDIAALTPAETLARLEQLAQANPADPQPHYFIGEQLKRQGRDGDAVRAYQSALRRDGTFAPALEGLGDALVRLSNGEVGPDAQNVYRAALAQDPTNLRIGFLIGLSDWQAGKSDEALLMWREMLSGIEEGAPERAMFEAWVEAAME